MTDFGYLRLINDIRQSDLICASCGAQVCTISRDATASFCNFCESYVDRESINAINSSAAIEKSMHGMQEAARNGAWNDGVQHADALAATKNPHFLFGAASFYKAFSDYTYSSVDYNQGGFMYSNADNRSDEQKNKYNAMALISKSKEYMFKTLKIVEPGISSRADYLYLKILSNIKLKRYWSAATDIVSLNGRKDGEKMGRYASMAFEIETLEQAKRVPKFPDPDNAAGSANIFYYMAKYLAKRNDVKSAIYTLSNLTKKVYMPMASYYWSYLYGIYSASEM